MEKDIRISDFSYELPDERIAKFPVEQRDQSKLLVYEHGHISETRFSHLPEFLPKDALMVFNNTRVIQARLHFRKETGALIEIFLLEPAEPADYEQVFQTSEACSWLCLVGNQKKWKEGTLSRMLEIKGEKVELRATRKGSVGTSQLIEFQWLVENKTFPLQGESKGAFSFADLLDAIGELPIPPYLNRDTEESDKSTYQTVYSRIKGSVAAPTAGLHFTEDVLKTIENQGITREEVTLHVGAGTFRPVKSETIEGPAMMRINRCSFPSIPASAALPQKLFRVLIWRRSQKMPVSQNCSRWLFHLSFQLLIQKPTATGSGARVIWRA